MQKQKLTEDHSDSINIDVAQFMETVANMNETVTVLNTNVNKLANNNMNRQRGTKPPQYSVADAIAEVLYARDCVGSNTPKIIAK